VVTVAIATAVTLGARTTDSGHARLELLSRDWLSAAVIFVAFTNRKLRRR
jgi:hypothetical protein